MGLIYSNKGHPHDPMVHTVLIARSSKSPSSLTTASQFKRHSRGSNICNLNNHQASILEGKTKRDELEEPKRQRQEDEEFDKKCKLIDEEVRAVQERQENVHEKREKIVILVEMN